MERERVQPPKRIRKQKGKKHDRRLPPERYPNLFIRFPAKRYSEAGFPWTFGNLCSALCPGRGESYGHFLSNISERPLSPALREAARPRRLQGGVGRCARVCLCVRVYMCLCGFRTCIVYSVLRLHLNTHLLAPPPPIKKNP